MFSKLGNSVRGLWRRGIDFVYATRAIKVGCRVSGKINVGTCEVSSARNPSIGFFMIAERTASESRAGRSAGRGGLRALAYSATREAE